MKAKGRKGTRGKTASGGQQQQEGEGAREGSRDRREEAAQAKKTGACNSNSVLRGVLDHPRANTSVQEREAPKQHPQHGVEGKAPHRAEAFVAMRRSEDRSQAVTTHHTTGMTTGPSQIQPDTRREGPAENDWTRRHQRTNQGGGQVRGERSQERAGQTEATPHHKSRDEQSNRGGKNNSNQRPTRPRNTTKTPQRTRTDQTTPDTQGQTEQAEANNRPKDTGPSTPPGKRHRKRRTPKRQKAYQTTAEKGGQKKLDNEKK